MTYIIHETWNTIAANFRDRRGVDNVEVLTAIHEAGHAAMVLSTGADLDLVTIRSTPKMGGRVEWAPPDLGRRRTQDENDRADMASYLISLGGPYAEDLLQPAIRSMAQNNLPGPSWTLDAIDIAELHKRTAGWLKEHKEGLHQLVRNTIRTYEREIDALAAELIYQRELTGDQVRRICRGLNRQGQDMKVSHFGSEQELQQRYRQMKRDGYDFPALNAALA